MINLKDMRLLLLSYIINLKVRNNTKIILRLFFASSFNNIKVFFLLSHATCFNFLRNKTNLCMESFAERSEILARYRSEK